MPREITILSRAEHDLDALAAAADGIGGATEIREIDAGAALQVISLRGEPLLTLYRPRMLNTEGEVARLLPDAPHVELPTWWCDAYAPMDETGEAGVSIALRLALAAEAVCLISD